jgi:hypothetical protein
MENDDPRSTRARERVAYGVWPSLARGLKMVSGKLKNPENDPFGVDLESTLQYGFSYNMSM